MRRGIGRMHPALSFFRGAGQITVLYALASSPLPPAVQNATPHLPHRTGIYRRITVEYWFSRQTGRREASSCLQVAEASFPPPSPASTPARLAHHRSFRPRFARARRPTSPRAFYFPRKTHAMDTRATRLLPPEAPALPSTEHSAREPECPSIGRPRHGRRKSS